jgi:hypothetical protein
VTFKSTLNIHNKKVHKPFEILSDKSIIHLRFWNIQWPNTKLRDLFLPIRQVTQSNVAKWRVGEALISNTNYLVEQKEMKMKGVARCKITMFQDFLKYLIYFNINQNLRA